MNYIDRLGSDMDDTLGSRPVRAHVVPSRMALVLDQYALLRLHVAVGDDGGESITRGTIAALCLRPEVMA